MAVIPSLDETHLEAICDVLGATSDGMTGSEIGRYLRECSIPDPLPDHTKRHRLFEALRAKQREDRCANNVLAFVRKVMNPVLYHQNPGYYSGFRSRLNKPLAFAGYQINERGEMVPVAAARTLSEAEERAGRLRSELSKRNVHPDVLHFCRAELLQDNYFHAVLEATKSVAEKIRAKTGLAGDGVGLADEALAIGKSAMPFLAFNSLRTESEQSEQKGLLNLMKGLFGTFRNPTAHAPKVSWNMTEQDALDLLTMASFLHRRLDNAVRTPRTA